MSGSRQGPSSSSSVLAAAAANGVNLVLGIGAATLLGRVLGPAGRGAYAALVNAGFLVCTVAVLGLQSATVVHASREPGRARAAAAAALAVAGAALLPALALALAFLPRRLGAQEPQTLEAAWRFLPAYAAAQAGFAILAAALQGLQAFAAWNRLRVAQMVLWLLLLGGAAAAGVRSAGTFALLFAASFAALVPLLLLALPRSSGPWLPSRAGAGSVARFAGSAALANLPLQLNRRLDQMAMAAVVAPAVLGHYAVAAALGALLVTVLGPAALVVLPKVAGASSDGDRAAILAPFCRTTVLAGAVAGLGLALAAPVLVLVLFGRDFAPAIAPAVVLAFAAAIDMVTRVLGDALLGLGRPSRVMRGEGIGLLVTAAGLALTLPRFPLLGAAFTSLVAYAVIALSLAVECRRALGVRVRDLLVPRREDAARALSVAADLLGRRRAAAAASPPRLGS